MHEERDGPWQGTGLEVLRLSHGQSHGSRNGAAAESTEGKDSHEKQREGTETRYRAFGTRVLRTRAGSEVREAAGG